MNEDIKYFALFADNGERIKTLVADGMPYTIMDILTAYSDAIEISPEEQELYMKGYIRGNDGMPKEQSVQIDMVKLQQTELIKLCARNKLLETDHDVVEYLELKHLSKEEYEKLKSQRQEIRAYRDKLLHDIQEATTVSAIKNIVFEM